MAMVPWWAPAKASRSVTAAGCGPLAAATRVAWPEPLGLPWLSTAVQASRDGTLPRGFERILS